MNHEALPGVLPDCRDNAKSERDRTGIGVDLTSHVDRICIERRLSSFDVLIQNYIVILCHFIINKYDNSRFPGNGSNDILFGLRHS
jgi:hypothetical protein